MKKYILSALAISILLVGLVALADTVILKDGTRIEATALRLESGAETFVVFRNADTDTVSIVHRRKDGSLGLIEPQ